MAKPQGIFSPAYKARQIAKTKASRARVAKAVQQQEIGRINAQQRVKPQQASRSSFADEYGILGSETSGTSQAARQAIAQSAEERAFSERQSSADRAYRTQAATTAFERQKELLEPQYTPLPQEAIGGVERLVEEYNKAFGEAKGANEARYQQLLGITDETTGQRAADIRSRSLEERSDLEQGLARTGLSNTTVSPTLTAGSRRREESSLNRLADQMQGTKLGIIERREDQYPDLSALQSSLSYLGEGYGGAGISTLFSALGGINQGTSVDPIPGNFQTTPPGGQAAPSQTQAQILPASSGQKPQRYLGSGVYG
ncbi:hypothetical protein LCGC14_2377490 [marine sediment metagenome]|uniref:Uncharacterized protein n=1 Tax=marine sediment metagenome TaxID=412755 RepID=A0A0F9C248_9ZZZZ